MCSLESSKFGNSDLENFRLFSFNFRNVHNLLSKNRKHSFTLDIIRCVWLQWMFEERSLFAMKLSASLSNEIGNFFQWKMRKSRKYLSDVCTMFAYVHLVHNFLIFSRIFYSANFLYNSIRSYDNIVVCEFNISMMRGKRRAVKSIEKGHRIMSDMKIENERETLLSSIRWWVYLRGRADKEEEKREILLIFIFIFNSMMDQSSIH